MQTDGGGVTTNIPVVSNNNNLIFRLLLVHKFSSGLQTCCDFGQINSPLYGNLTTQKDPLILTGGIKFE
jgi:hypothetical protein